MLRDFTIWLANNLDHEDLETIRDEGATNSFPGMIDYHETEELYNQFSYDMWEAITNLCETTGLKFSEILVNIIGEGCQSHRQFANNMVLFAAEMYAEEAIGLKFETREAETSWAVGGYINLAEDDEETDQVEDENGTVIGFRL